MHANTSLRNAIASRLGQVLTPEVAVEIEMSAQTPSLPEDPGFEEHIRYALRGHEGAVDFFLTLRDVLHFWDDLIDLDQRITPEYINRSMFAALIELPNNEFYRANYSSLSAILVNAIANWQTANQFEADGDDRRLSIAYVIRSDYANLLIHCAYLVGGYDWMTEVTPIIRDWWTKENFGAYKSNLQREMAARFGKNAELVQSWYEEETKEYLDSGLTVFNAAMLAETEEGHVDALIALIKPPKGAVVVDMGCGVGGVSRLMKARDPSATFYGVTNVMAQVEKMRELGGVEPVLSNYHHTTLPDGIADVVMFNESIGYGNLPVLLKESMRLLKPGGVVAIKDGISPTGNDEWSSGWQWMTFAKGRIDSEAESLGFKVEVSHEVEYDMTRFQEFVHNNPTMRDRYGEVTNLTSGLVVPSWFWLLRKQGV